MLWKTRQSSLHRMTIEVEGHGPIQVGAVDARSRRRESRKRFSARKTEGISRPYRDNRELGPDRLNQLLGRGIGAAVMANLQQVRPGMFDGRDAALRALFGVSFEQQRRLPVSQAQHHGVAVLRLVANRPVTRGEQYPQV